MAVHPPGIPVDGEPLDRYDWVVLNSIVYATYRSEAGISYDDGGQLP